VTVIDNTSEQRFEITAEDALAYLAYHRDAERLVLVHTFVPDAMRRRGIGGQLVATAVETAIASNLTVVPECPFVRAWLVANPTTAERVRIG
jgi:hypothetical protein